MRSLVLMMAAASWPALAVAQQAPAVATPAQSPVQTPAQSPVQTPADSAAQTPAQTLAQTPAQTPAEPEAAEPDAEGEEDTISDEPDIIVTGTRTLRGSVVGDIPPDQQLGPADIRSYGVSSVADLLTELAPQTRSGAGGAPVVLLDGRRIAGFQEIRDIPTEAIARVEILPEEVALKYGYSADQRVVNIVLRRRFRATTVEAAARVATEGGRSNPQAELDLLNIRNGGRFNVHAEYQEFSPLFESERSILAAPTETPGTTAFDQRPYRTLQSFSRDLSINTIYARPIGAVSATLNAQLQATDSVGRFGLPSAQLSVPATSPFAVGGTATTITRVLDGGDFQPLKQRNAAMTAHLGTTLTGVVDSWNWSLTGSYDRVESETVTDVGVDASGFQARLNANDPGANPLATLTQRDIGAAPSNRGNSVSSVGVVDALINGSPFELPAGKVSTAIRLGATTSDFTSRSFRAGLTQTGAVARDGANGRINIDLPIASRSRAVLGAIGNFSLSANAAINQLSDFGTLTSYGYGANWSPVDGVRVIGSINHQEGAPSASQLGNPVITTPNSRIFDYVRGATVTVTTLGGGNPLLRADDRRVQRLGLTLKPWSETDLTLTANYVDTRIDNPIVSFPSPTAAIEAAFPDRFTRDAGGALTRIDTRPINFARSDRSEVRWGVNFSKPIKSKVQRELEAFRAGTGPNPFAGLPGGGRPRGERGAGDRAGRAGADGGTRGGGGGGGGGGFRGGGGGAGGGGRGQGGGRVQFALYHTWHLTDRVLVADAGPSLDLLRGDAIGGSGGQPRHELEGQAGYSNNGVGVRLSANYATGTRVNGGTAANPEPLAFGGLATANLRIFADLGQQLGLARAHPWVRGMRVTLSVDNVLNTRQRVTDATGSTPISFQPDYLDPLGRSVRISLRKLFF
ncbi:MAG TPA: TonB-dependent receptor [Sphingomonas sp.]|nr:TonB-dependent receptor [Sphingomonas sp.]